MTTTTVDDLVTTMRQQAETYQTAIIDLEKLFVEWQKTVSEHNKEEELVTEYGVVDHTCVEKYFEDLPCECNCKHLDKEYWNDSYWDDIRESQPYAALDQEVKQGTCMCGQATKQLQEAEKATRPLIKKLRDRLRSLN